jgi:cytochrome c oxidase assembly protein subunit 15
VAAQKLRRHALGVTAMIVVMAITGGFVAGTKAGFAFNTYPLMSGQWLPPGYLGMTPLWHNFTENIATIQFNHRWLAIITGLLVLALRWRARGLELDTATRTALNLLLLLVVIQISLGITTLLSVVPVALGTAHQGGALALLSGALWVNHRLRRQPG